MLPDPKFPEWRDGMLSFAFLFSQSAHDDNLLDA
jgi:hypothetical protein